MVVNGGEEKAEVKLFVFFFRKLAEDAKFFNDFLKKIFEKEHLVFVMPPSLPVHLSRGMAGRLSSFFSKLVMSDDGIEAFTSLLAFPNLGIKGFTLFVLLLLCSINCVKVLFSLFITKVKMLQQTGTKIFNDLKMLFTLAELNLV